MLTALDREEYRQPRGKSAGAVDTSPSPSTRNRLIEAIKENARRTGTRARRECDCQLAIARLRQFFHFSGFFAGLIPAAFARASALVDLLQ